MAPPDKVELLAQWAGQHGRTISEELRLGMALLLLEHQLNLLRSPEGEGYAASHGLTIEQATEAMEADLAELRGEVFPEPAFPAIS